MGETTRADFIERRIYLIRGQAVMLDRDLAKLYEVATFNLNKAVARNKRRFPPDFMFRLSKEEYGVLRFQIGILEKGRHSKYLPHAFTEHGVVMLSAALRNRRAIQVSIAVVRAFSRLRRLASAHKELPEVIVDHERRLDAHDQEIRSLHDAVHEFLDDSPEEPRPAIGFRP